MVIDINGSSVSYDVIGTGIPILMIHGWGTDHRILKGCMEPIFFEIKYQFKRVYIDLPGMGQSKRGENIQSTDDYLSFLKFLISKVIPNEKYIVVGKSYGGYLSRGLAKEQNNSILGMLQICPLVKPKTQRLHAPERCVLLRDDVLFNEIPEEEKKEFELFHVIQTRDTWESYRDNILPGVKLADFKFLNNILEKNKEFTIDIDKVKAKYNFPTLLLSGKQDWCVGYSDLWEIAENYKRVTYVVLDKAGHNLEYEQPAIFKSHVKKWLEDVVMENR